MTQCIAIRLGEKIPSQYRKMGEIRLQDLRHDVLNHSPTSVGGSGSKYPPAEPEALRLLAPQRGLIATVKIKPQLRTRTGSRAL